MNKQSAYFSDYELMFLNFTFAPTSRTHIGVFTLFPIVNSFLETFSEIIFFIPMETHFKVTFVFGRQSSVCRGNKQIATGYRQPAKKRRANTQKAVVCKSM